MLQCILGSGYLSALAMNSHHAMHSASVPALLSSPGTCPDAEKGWTVKRQCLDCKGNSVPDDSSWRWLRSASALYHTVYFVECPVQNDSVIEMLKKNAVGLLALTPHRS